MAHWYRFCFGGACYVAEVEILQTAEVRVLGALLEKDITTPEYYPLTLNALQNACNQKSSRDPVVNYTEDTVSQALELLQHKGLVLRISGAGHRVEKWSHRLGEVLNFGRRELAILCVLMLRGPQTVGELRGRTERMHEFADMEEVERVLESLAALEPKPLVARASRGRWVQLLSGPYQETEDQTAPHIERSSGLEERVTALEREMSELRAQLQEFRRQFE
jgi:uncharacterized protein YceH (UPF0502 family)